MKINRLVIFSLIVLFFVLSMSIVSAEDINETQDDLLTDSNVIEIGAGDYSQLSRAVQSSNVVIVLTGDIKRSSSNTDIQFDSDNVTIEGNNHVIDANNLGRVFGIQDGDLTLKNLKLINGNGYSGRFGCNDGGAILNLAKLTLIDCTFENNKAYQGGALSCDRATTIISGTTVFSNNHADNDAGAIYNFGGSTMKVTGKITFNNNDATGKSVCKGGAILNVFSNSYMSIEGESSFTNNRAVLDGGAIFNHQATFVMNGKNTFINNKAGDDDGKGGAINNENGTFSLSGTNIFRSNSAVRGGAIDNSLFQSVLTINGQNEFTNNKANLGGAIANQEAKRLNIYGVNTFNSNSADTIGGAIISYGGSLIIDAKNTFNKNTAKYTGGAIYVSNGYASIKGANTFTSNSAAIEGGALLLIDCNRIDLSGENIFNSNSAPSAGGAIRAINIKNLILDNHNYFENNKASHSGGAIYASNSNLNCQGAMFESNTAAFGGAINVYLSSLSANYNIFKNNAASDAGPDIQAYQSSVNSLENNYWNSQDRPSKGRVSNYDVSRIRNWVVIDFTIPPQITQNTNTEVVRFKNNAFNNLNGEMPNYAVSASPNFSPSQVIISKNVGISQYVGNPGQVTVNVASSNFGGSKVVNVIQEVLSTSLSGNNIVLDNPSQSANYVVTLNDVNGKALSGKTISITVDGKKYTQTTNNQGKATLTLSGLKNGYHEITSTYSGESKYSKSSTTNGVICTFSNQSNAKLTGNDMETYYKDGSRYVVTLTDSNGSPLASKAIKIYISGGIYSRTTDNNGKASIAINLNSGKSDVLACFPGDNKYGFTYVENSLIIKSTVSGNDVVKYYKNGTQYYAKFLNAKGQTLKNTQIEFNINGVFYKRTTNASGYAKMNINLNPGTYTITATNPINGEMHSNKITVLGIFSGKDLTKYYKNDSQYVVKVLGGDGKPLTGGTVKFNINGVFYNRDINGSGYAKMNINLNPGTYTITAEYNGLRHSNTITVKPVLYAKDLSMKYRDGSKFQVKLVDGQGKAFANQNITFNVNGVLYHRVTNAQGYAGLTINLISGQYIITSTYGTANLANKITISS